LKLNYVEVLEGRRGKRKKAWCGAAPLEEGEGDFEAACSPRHLPHPARLSFFSSFFQLILWQKALVALYHRNPKQRERMS
jgi:hypothetical protein